MELPQTRYAKSGDVHIAYQVVGEGPPDLVYVPSFTHHVELNWENPPAAAFLRRLADLGRLLVFDKRGTGMSDRVEGLPTLEARMDDLRAVMDAAGSERAALFALGDAGPMCLLFAATYPERTSALVLLNSSPRYVRGPDFPWLPTRADEERLADEMLRRWGDPSFLDERFRRSNPSATEDQRRALARVVRLSVSPGAVAAYLRMNMEMDVCGILPLVRVPTLVMHRRDASPDIASGRYVADHILGAHFVELPGADFGPVFGDTDRILQELEGFLSQVPAAEAVGREPDRVLTTVLFTDIVGSTAKAAELGDAAWRELLHRHHDLIRRALTKHRGRELDTAGDGFFASFDGPARAIQCAWTIREAVPELGLQVRAGLHTGECELVDGKVGGIAVHIGARVARQAGPGEVLVSQTVKDLVAGSGIGFSERGAAELKGVPGEWRLFAVERV